VQQKFFTFAGTREKIARRYHTALRMYTFFFKGVFFYFFLFLRTIFKTDFYWRNIRRLINSIIKASIKGQLLTYYPQKSENRTLGDFISEIDKRELL
jgi:hypothetical protein